MQLVNGLNFNNIRGDIYGGLTAAVVALPLAMAMGVASGVGPIAGLYGAIFVGFFAALLGGTPAQVSGPTGPMTVVMAAIFIQYTGMFPDDPGQGAALAFTVVVLGGLFQIVFGVLRLGKYIELVPHPVVSGFMSGIGVIIILLQIGPLVGEAAISRPLEAAKAIPAFVSHIEYHSFELGMAVLAMVYGIPLFLPKLNRLIPAPLFALVAGTLFYVLYMDFHVPVIGDIPSGFPSFHLPVIDMALALQMVASGLTLAGLGAIDSLLTSLVADNITRTQHKPDRELIGQGIGNTVAGLFGGLPGAGATMRTVVNVNAGGRTPISGALHALVLLGIVLGAGPLASEIPKAVLAGILIKVGTDIIDWDYLRRIPVAPKAGVLIMFTVLIVTVTIDLLLAVGIG
ncbi:MAG: SulP family inorganic anion transporter, partial [Gammaproteobacteria bacterium]|nr:SulP family inorganic anion transporter [Gammaproteobacteria bacterium]